MATAYVKVLPAPVSQLVEQAQASSVSLALNPPTEAIVTNPIASGVSLEVLNETMLYREQTVHKRVLLDYEFDNLLKILTTGGNHYYLGKNIWADPEKCSVAQFIFENMKRWTPSISIPDIVTNYMNMIPGLTVLLAPMYRNTFEILDPLMNVTQSSYSPISAASPDPKHPDYQNFITQRDLFFQNTYATLPVGTDIVGRYLQPMANVLSETRQALEMKALEDKRNLEAQLLQVAQEQAQLAERLKQDELAAEKMRISALEEQNKIVQEQTLFQQKTDVQEADKQNQIALVQEAAQKAYVKQEVNKYQNAMLTQINWQKSGMQKIVGATMLKAAPQLEAATNLVNSVSEITPAQRVKIMSVHPMLFFMQRK